MPSFRKPDPSDVSDEEWGLVASYLALLPEDAGQREHGLHEVFSGPRYVIRSGCPWRMVPNDLPPWAVVYQQAQRWLAARCFQDLVDDLRAVLRMAAGRDHAPTAAVLESHTLRSTPESGQRAGYDEHKRKKGSKLHMAVDTLGHLIALHVTPASVDDRTQVGKLAEAVQAATGDSVDLAYVDQGYTGDKPAAAAEKQGIKLKVVKLPEAKRGFVLLPRRWVVERSFAWACRFRRLVKDHEGYPRTTSRRASASRRPHPGIACCRQGPGSPAASARFRPVLRRSAPSSPSKNAPVEAATRSCVDSGRIRPFTSRSDAAQSSNVVSTNAPAVHDVRTMPPAGTRTSIKTQL